MVKKRKKEEKKKKKREKKRMKRGKKRMKTTKRADVLQFVTFLATAAGAVVFHFL